GPMDLLRAVCAAQAELVTAWMSVGFIHGVMNTDNCSIAGETIDYGPCAFMDGFHNGRVFSSIDQQGRYAYGNQLNIAVWNMAQLGTSLLFLMEDQEAGVEEATEIVHAMPDQMEAAWLRRFGAKIGLSTPRGDDLDLVRALLALMQDGNADFTNTFHALGKPAARDQFTNREAFDLWEKAWQDRLVGEPSPSATMAFANPAV
ncbi:MAG: protein adenylyltransferase SelO family protein, partial [Paracoccaceae bacterium]